MSKHTFQPSRRRRSRRIGFLARKRKGKNILARRRRKKRSRLTVA